VSILINILLARFLYESASRSFSLVTFWHCNFLAKNIAEKGMRKRAQNVDEIDPF